MLLNRAQTRSTLSKLFDPPALRWAWRRRALAFSLSRLSPDATTLKLERLGTAYGGWFVPLELIDSSWMVYSGGAGHDVSFDVELLRRFGCRVRAFDPMGHYLTSALEQAEGLPGYSVHELAITGADGPIELFGAGDNTGHVDARSKVVGGPSFTINGKSIKTIADELGDTEVQLLKLDIEGEEFAVIDGLDFAALGLRVLCVEVHPSHPTQQTRELIATCTSHGFGLVNVDECDLTFVHRNYLGRRQLSV